MGLYKSVVAAMVTNADGFILLCRLNTEGYKVVSNLWDTVADFERVLNAKGKDVLSKLSFSLKRCF